MNLFSFKDPFQIVEGAAPISVGAPHHGTRPNVDADLGTGPTALALAERLGARAVIVSDMRRTVDVNKNPLTLSQTVQRHAIRYQNELFHHHPWMVIEIHGHVSGQYPIEVSTGFELDEASEEDASYIHQLKNFQQSLFINLMKYTGIRSSVGVYPLDRDVKKTATNTYTFQKIRRARKLAGIDCIGLHIELSAEFRTTQNAKKKSFIDALADSLSASIQDAFPAPPLAGDRLKVSQVQFVTTQNTEDWQIFLLAPDTKKAENQNIVAIHPDDFERLGALDGDSLILKNGHEEIRCTVVSSRIVSPNQMAIPPRVRRQISLGSRGQVRAKLESAHHSETTKALVQAGGSFMIAKTRSTRGAFVWLPPGDIQQTGLRPEMSLHIQGQPEIPPRNSVTLAVDSELRGGTAMVSESLMNSLTLTMGDVITVGALS